MPSSAFHPLRVVLGAFLASSTGSVLAADSEDASAPARLHTTGFVPGQTHGVTLRSTAVGSPASIRWSPSSGAVVFANPLLPTIRLGAPSFNVIAGLIGTDGRLGVAATVPPTFPSGTYLHVQGFVRSAPGTAWFSSEPVVVLVTGAGASFSDATATLDPLTALSSSSDVDWADFDRDGWQDVVVANGDGGEMPALLRNDNGSLVHETATRLPLAAQVPASCLELGDVDLDGDVDLFLGTSGDASMPAPNLLLLNDGTGVFSLAAGFPAGSGEALDAEFGDVDGDRDLDLLLANRADPLHPSEVADPVMILVNQGGAQGGSLGTFLADPLFGSLPGNDSHNDGGDVSLGDLDDDGDLDVHVARTQGSVGAQNQLYVNDGTGAFTEVTATALPAILDNSFEADFADFDGDGLLDVFVANSISTVPLGAHLLLNQGPIGPGGTPVFTDASANVPASFGPNTKVRLALDVGDADLDGDPDVVIGVHELPLGPPPATAGSTVLLINQGGRQAGTPGVFVVDTNFDPGSPLVIADVAFGDIDRDNDLDVYLANSGRLFVPDNQDRLLSNDF